MHHDDARWSVLWISQHVVLGRIYSGLPTLWITHLSMLWITMLRICGLRACRPCGLAASQGEPSSRGTGYRLPNEPGALV